MSDYGDTDGDDVVSVVSLLSEFGYQVDCHQLDFRVYKEIKIY
jgi:hypothetical protein